MKYTWSKRLVSIERLLASPFRPGRTEDFCASVSTATADAIAFARAKAKPLALGALATCVVLDVSASLSRSTRVDGEVVVATSSTPSASSPSAVAQVSSVPVGLSTASQAAPPALPAPAAPAPAAPAAPAPRKPAPSAPFPKRPVDALRTARVASATPKVGAKGTSSRGAGKVVVLSEKEVAAHLEAAGFARRDVARLTCTARFESGYNPRAKNRNTNGTQDSGLFQVNDVWLGPCAVTRTGLFDPAKSARCAKKIHDAQGARAWMAFQERRHICENYRVGDFERKGLRTIRSIVEASRPRKASRVKSDVSMASKAEVL